MIRENGTMQFRPAREDVINVPLYRWGYAENCQRKGCRFAGWGVTRPFVPVIPEGSSVPRTLTMDLTSDIRCEAYPTTYRNAICALDSELPTRHSVYDEDRGGDLFCKCDDNFYLFGVLAYT